MVRRPLGQAPPMVIAVSWIFVAMSAAGVATSVESLIAARFFTGIGIGALAPLVATFVTDSAPTRRRTLHLTIAMGSIGGGGTASVLLGRLLLPESHFQVLFLLGAVSLVLVPAIWFADSNHHADFHTLGAVGSMVSASTAARTRVGGFGSGCAAGSFAARVPGTDLPPFPAVTAPISDAATSTRAPRLCSRGSGAGSLISGGGLRRRSRAASSSLL
ncbi:MFS transporter [Nocardia salmonicida]|uniref:MFS transporter n=1 Tax=Nocardia salmonicida TaxID=53431 RepID=UPI00378B7C11